jgi:hypothetical protein
MHAATVSECVSDFIVYPGLIADQQSPVYALKMRGHCLINCDADEVSQYLRVKPQCIEKRWRILNRVEKGLRPDKPGDPDTLSSEMGWIVKRARCVESGGAMQVGTYGHFNAGKYIRRPRTFDFQQY